MRNLIVLTLFFIAIIFNLETLIASPFAISVDTLTTVIDGNSALFNQVKPGDTIQFEAGNRAYILIRNFTGQPGKPILFQNKKGQVIIDTDHYYGISIQNCRYIRLSGTGDPENFYGFKISRVQNGAGIGINDLSSDFEIDHVSIENTLIGGIYAKSDPDCTLASTRENFTQFNTLIHDNYIANTGNEGMYIGSTKYFGQHVNCNGIDTLMLPSLLSGVRIYNNIVKHTGWDGIQVSSAATDCQVYANLVMFDSQSEYFSQMSGIMIGGGSKCDCYNNYISNGKGCGIECHGLGGNRIFNNVILDAGRSFQPTDTSQMKYGIYVTDISVEKDSSFFILFNDIINPKSDGIRFTSVRSKGNIIASNAIINPGTYDYYEHSNTSYTGNDSYIMIPNDSSDVMIANNYFSRNIGNAGFAGTNFTLNEHSPLVDAGYSNLYEISFDGFLHPRIYGNAPDIGAYEYNPAFLGIGEETKYHKIEPLVFPNPVRSNLIIKYYCEEDCSGELNVYNVNGCRLINKTLAFEKEGKQEISENVSALPTGIYIYQLISGQQTVSGKFIKEN